VINKWNDSSFSVADEKVFSSYLQFCGIGLRNAQLYEKSQLEVKRNQVLLDLARMIFEEQSTMEHVVFRILTHTQSFIQCQRVQVSYPIRYIPLLWVINRIRFRIKNKDTGMIGKPVPLCIRRKLHLKPAFIEKNFQFIELSTLTYQQTYF